MIMLGQRVISIEMALKKKNYLFVEALCFQSVGNGLGRAVPSIGRLLCYLFNFNKNYL